MFETHLYGCPITSDIPLLETGHVTRPISPGMKPLSLRRAGAGQGPGDLDVSFNVPESHGRKIMIRSDRDVQQLMDGQPWCFEVADILTFFGRGGDDRIYYQPTEQATEELIGFWFVHVIVPYCLTVERDYSFLHASAVNLQSESIIFMAESHSGKSTLANYFLDKGHSLVSDDKVAVIFQDGQYLAVPSHPYYRPHRRFEDLGYHSDSFAAAAKPLRAVFLIDRTNHDAIALERVRGADALSCLMAACLSVFPVFWIGRLEFLGDMAETVPIVRVNRPWGMEHMAEVYRTLSEYREGLG
jgi:hypothetical protein